MRHAAANRIYRLIWSHVHQTWIAVSENARGRGKRASRAVSLAVASILLASGSAAFAAPTGGVVTAGSGTISQSGATTTVTQSSQNVSVNWNSFNTTSQETVNFVQPSASAIAVNRIADTNATQFLGHLNANGQVWLINPNGIVFGAGAQINVGGLVASTLDTTDGGLSSAARRFTGSGTGSILNQGTITTANGGYVAFIGNKVSNTGTIVSPSGAVALGGGNDVTLTFAGDSLLKLEVNQSTLDNLAANGGLIRADGGMVVLSAGARDALLASVVNNTGVIRAASVENVNGTIVLNAGGAGTATNAGTLDASGTASGQTGGTVNVLGQNVHLASGSRIDVSGDAGGGTALVGGNFHGTGSEQNAQNTTVDAGSTIDADAVTTGNGGNVAVWSDQTTQFNGSITARGGANAGNGGQVETSGHTLDVSAAATVNTLAPKGSAGDWLLDPADMTIGSVSLWGTSAGITVDAVALTNALNTGNVTVATSASGTGNGDIKVLDTIGMEGTYDGTNVSDTLWETGNYTLTLSAYRNIHFVYTQNAALASGTFDQGGGVELGNNSVGGNVVLRADNTGTGTGTVIFDDATMNYIDLGSSQSTVKIYYNPTAYSSPTDFTPYIYNLYSPAPTQLTSYMAVNVAASIASKTYDGTTAAEVSSVSTQAALPTGVTLDTSGATASFVTAGAGTGKAVSLTGITFSGGGDTVTYNSNNYYINGLDSQTATITQKILTVSGVSASSKTYDGTTTATLTGTAALSGIVGSDTVTLTGGTSAAFADANAGTNKAVTVSGYSLSGTSSANYSVAAPTLTATINKADLTLSGTKTYDGTTTVAGSTLTATGVAGQTFAVTGSGDTSNLAGKNVQTATLGSVTGLSLGSSANGGLSSNYNAIATTGSTYSVTPRTLTESGITAQDKTYDGTTAAVLNIQNSTLSGYVIGDSLIIGESTTGTFSDKNVGSNKAVTIYGFTLGGADAGNYVLVMPTNVTATITKADLAVSGVGAANKTYDGTTAATVTGAAAVSAFGSDVVSVVGTGTATFADKNAGSNKAVTVSGYALTGADAGNYNLVEPANVTATIGKADLLVSGLTATGKTYDGTTAAALSGTASVSAIGSDVVSLAGTGVGTFADKNVGVNKVVTVTGYTLTGTDADNYNVVSPSSLTATVSKADLTLTGVAAADKVYDGTTAATLTGLASVSALGSDVVSVAGTGGGTFADKNVGASKGVAITGYTLAGADAGNYTLVEPSNVTATITRADLSVTGVGAANKTYDGTTTATLTGTAAVSAIGSDVVSLTGSGSGAFADKNAGTGKAVSVSGFTLTGADAGNYTLVEPSTVTADIAKADLTVTGLGVANKVYDGTTAAALTGIASVSAIGSDVVSVTGTTVGTFADKNAGTGKAVTVSGYTLSGADAGNYTVVAPSNLTADISKADLMVAGVGAANKVYDGTTAATLTGTAAVSAIGADVVSVMGSGTGTFADKNAGTGKSVNVSGYTLGGADAGNYNVVEPSNVTADISKADLTVSGVGAVNKVYDGTTVAALTGTAAVSAIGADVVTVTGSGIGTFADKNVGSAKAVAVTGFTLSGADASNYNVVGPTGLVAAITPATLIVSGITAGNKVYDGTTAATVSIGNASLAGVIGGDVLTLSSIGTFSDAGVGNGKTVNLSNALGGADAGNYSLTGQTTTTANIAALPPTPVSPPPAVTVTETAQSPQIQSAVAQVQSIALPPQAQTQPLSLATSSTLEVKQTNSADTSTGQQRETTRTAIIDTASGFGNPAPVLQIQNGGIRLPSPDISISQ